MFLLLLLSSSQQPSLCLTTNSASSAPLCSSHHMRLSSQHPSSPLGPQQLQTFTLEPFAPSSGQSRYVCCSLKRHPSFPFCVFNVLPYFSFFFLSRTANLTINDTIHPWVDILCLWKSRKPAQMRNRHTSSPVSHSHLCGLLHFSQCHHYHPLQSPPCPAPPSPRGWRETANPKVKSSNRDPWI